MVCGSDDLHDLTRLKEAVKESEALVLLQSFRVLERPCSSTATRTEVVAALSTPVCPCEWLSCGSRVALMWLFVFATLIC